MSISATEAALASLDFAEIEALQVAGEWDRAGDILAAEAAQLQTAGAELLVLCTNTMHKVADRVQAALSNPLIHLADTTATAVRTAGLTEVGLLATAFTMEQDFYRDRLASHGLRVLVPDATDRGAVHRIIYDELCRGVIRAESRKIYQQVISRLVGAGAQGVILGCTEIELLIREPSPLSSADTAHDVHVAPSSATAGPVALRPSSLFRVPSVRATLAATHRLTRGLLLLRGCPGIGPWSATRCRATTDPEDQRAP